MTWATYSTRNPNPVDLVTRCPSTSTVPPTIINRCHNNPRNSYNLLSTPRSQNCFPRPGVRHCSLAGESSERTQRCPPLMKYGQPVWLMASYQVQLLLQTGSDKKYRVAGPTSKQQYKAISIPARSSIHQSEQWDERLEPTRPPAS